MVSRHTKLPDRMLITGHDPQQQKFLIQLESVLQTGGPLVQLRTPGLQGRDYLILAIEAQKLCASYAAKLVLNPPVDGLPLPLAAGLHLTSRHLMAMVARPYESSPERLLGASCHNAEELAKAAMLGLDYVSLSPVLATSSHPQAQPLGWAEFAKLTQQVQIPVYALGGLDITDLPIALQHGAQGIAAIKGLWVYPASVR